MYESRSELEEERKKLQVKLVCTNCGGRRKRYEIIDGYILGCQECPLAIKIPHNEVRILGLHWNTFF